MYRPSDLHAFLNEWGIHPKKALSQNFLIDANVWRKMIASAGVSPGDLILEIGPGPGSLTQLLLEAGASVLAIEKDERLAQALQRYQTTDCRLEVLSQDVLDVSIFAELGRRLRPGQQAKVVANIPFHLTAPILEQLIPHHTLISTAALIVQEEIAQRCTALPSTPEYSHLSLFLRFYSDPSYGFFIRRTCFYPRPKVDCAVVLFRLKPPPHEVDPDEFFRLTKKAFATRRKMLRSSWNEIIPKEILADALQAIGKPVTIRPENLSLDDFVALYHVWKQLEMPSVPPVGKEKSPKKKNEKPAKQNP